MLKVLKFGGSSLADAQQFAKVKAIVEADESSRVVIVSAPGKRFSGDHKITAAAIAKMLGIDLVHFGVVVVLNMMIGLVHPPFGMLLFVTNALTGIPIKDMMKEGWLFLVMLLILLLAVTLIPEIILWLPQKMGYVTQ